MRVSRERRALGLIERGLGERPSDRGDRAPVVSRQSHQSRTRIVKLRFYNILTAPDSTNLELTPLLYKIHYRISFL